jgi:hypothetical protein
MKGLPFGEAAEFDENDEQEASCARRLFSRAKPKPISESETGTCTVATNGLRLTS